MKILSGSISSFLYRRYGHHAYKDGNHKKPSTFWKSYQNKVKLRVNIQEEYNVAERIWSSESDTSGFET